MPDIDTMKTSNYLQKEDVGNGVLVTITKVEMVQPDKNSKSTDPIWLVHFVELPKPLWSKPTTREQIAQCTGQRNTDNWAGKQVVLWNDPSVSFQGKTGGIRVRPAQNQQQQYDQPDRYRQNPQSPPSNYLPEFNDDIPGFD